MFKLDNILFLKAEATLILKAKVSLDTLRDIMGSTDGKTEWKTKKEFIELLKEWLDDDIEQAIQNNLAQLLQSIEYDINMVEEK